MAARRATAHPKHTANELMRPRNNRERMCADSKVRDGREETSVHVRVAGPPLSTLFELSLNIS